MSDQALLILSGVLGVVACVSLFRAVFSDMFCLRLRRVRRCPKCWYDMSHTPGLRCSECGYLGPRERSLWKWRFRKPWIVATFVFATSSYALGVAPTVHQHGALSLVPTSILISYLPPVGEEYWFDKQVDGWVYDPVAVEMSRRVESAKLWDWQWRAIIQRCGIVRTREKWPAEVPLAIAMQQPSWLGANEVTALPLNRPHNEEFEASAGTTLRGFCALGIEFTYMREAYQPIGIYSAGTRRVPLQVTIDRVPGTGFYKGAGRRTKSKGDERAWQGIITLPVEIVSDLEDVIQPQSSPELDQELRRGLTIQIVGSMEHFGGMLDARVTLKNPVQSEVNGAAMCLNIELLHIGKSVDAVELALQDTSRWNPPEAGMRERWQAGSFESITTLDLLDSRDSGFSDWCVRVSAGDPRHVLGDWDCDTHWSGELLYDLADVIEIRN